jgi:outer membrane immunogenic protein
MFTALTTMSIPYLFLTLVPMRRPRHLPRRPTFTTTTYFSRRLDYLGTVRGRVGVLARPDLLLYATGGLAYGRVDKGGSVFTAVTNSVFGNRFSFSQGFSSNTRTGYSVGGGFEWLLMRNWSVRAEYLYYDLDSDTLVVPFVGVAVFPSFFTMRSHDNGNLVRVGLNYQFH